MIRVTKLDGNNVLINELNIQWIESLPDTSVIFIGGARLLVREKPEEIARLLGTSLESSQATQSQFFDGVKALP